MDHEPDYGSVCLCGDLGSGSCPPSLPVYGFPGKGRLCSPHREDMMLIILLTLCTHRHAFGVQREDQVKN